MLPGEKNRSTKLNRWSEAMLTVKSATYLDGFRIRLAFSDGVSGVADLDGHLHGPIFEPLCDPDYFAGFSLTDHTLEWPNGADFAPEYLHEMIASAVGPLR
jgi:hypothetical protein